MDRRYPIGIQTFETVRKEGYCYVDKTALVHQLVQNGKYYFLSRPRRFGKSLLISTLEAYFQGKKELFDGLALEHLEREWTEYPVLHLDLNAQKYDSPEALEDVLNYSLSQWEAIYGTNPAEKSPSLRFQGIIQRAAERCGRNVVVLVDEYDKPLLQALGNEPLLTAYRQQLKAFYGVLKSKDAYLRFALLTGVTKFSKVSVFSDLNNLQDISMSPRFATLCGITEQELYDVFEEDIRLLGEHNGMSEEETRKALKDSYDGYHFTANCPDLYNPFSLLNAFSSKELGSYWFETGTPTFLIQLLKQGHYNLYNLYHEQVSKDMLGDIDNVGGNPLPMLYQSGYLTLKGYDREFGTYTLGFPNREVAEGFNRHLLLGYAKVPSGNPTFQIQNFVLEVRRGDTDAFLQRLQSFFADTPYELARDLELHYQNVLFIVFKLLGFYVQVEYHTSRGRIDLVLKTADYIYVMEFKLEGTAEEALQQIEDKHYALPFATDQRRVYKVGVNFSKDKRNIEKWLVKEA